MTRRVCAPGQEPIRWSHGVGLFLLALATLLLELALTRVLSVALWYHFGFLVIATALLGFGTAGVVLAVWPWLREQAALDRLLALLALGFGVLTIAASGCCNSSRLTRSASSRSGGRCCSWRSTTCCSRCRSSVRDWRSRCS